jgi:hypothetical protein
MVTDMGVRMVLYFPVSALVTLFGNILQNPLDPRARSDTRLMNVVVSFLSMLGQEAETGGVHRMLGVCSEFERIAKVVIDKAEKENSSRRKRKSNDPSSAAKAPPTAPVPAMQSTRPAAPGSASARQNGIASNSRPSTANTPRPHQDMPAQMNGHSPPNMSNPEALRRTMASNGFGSPMATAASAMSQSKTPSPAMLPPATWPSGMGMANGGPGDAMDYASFTDLTGFGHSMPDGYAGIQSPPQPPGSAGFFQQPLLPADIYNLPHALDWDWAEMSGGAYPSVENGSFAAHQQG